MTLGMTRAAEAARAGQTAQKVRPIRSAGRAAGHPDPRQRPLLAAPCLVLEPDIDRLAARVLGQSRRYLAWEVFLMSLGRRVGLRMTGTRCQRHETEGCQLHIDRALLQDNLEHLLDPPLQVLSPAAHHSVTFGIGPCSTSAANAAFCSGIGHGWRPGDFAVGKTANPSAEGRRGACNQRNRKPMKDQFLNSARGSILRFA